MVMLLSASPKNALDDSWITGATVKISAKVMIDDFQLIFVKYQQRKYSRQ